RNLPANAARSVLGVNATSGGRGWAQPMKNAPTSDARHRLPLLDDIQGSTLHVDGVAAHHDLELPRLDYALHVGAMVGQLLGPDLERDGARFSRLQRDAPEPAQLLDRPRRHADGVPDVKLHDLVSRPG